jgi:hypothetical protein
MSRKRVLFRFCLKLLEFDARKKSSEPGTKVSRISSMRKVEGRVARKGEGCLSHAVDVREDCGLYTTSCRGRRWADTGGAVLRPGGHRDLELPPPESGRCLSHHQHPHPGAPAQTGGGGGAEGIAGNACSQSEPEPLSDTPSHIKQGRGTGSRMFQPRRHLMRAVDGQNRETRRCTSGGGRGGAAKPQPGPVGSGTLRVPSSRRTGP